VKRYLLKIVSNAHLNAEGEWIEVQVDQPLAFGWINIDKMFQPYIPEGFHLVAVRRKD